MTFARKFLTIAGYACLTLVVLGVTFLLVAYGKGYGFDFRTHRLTLNGLLISSSQPNGATLTISGHGSHHTPYRTTLEVGSYQLSASLAGYQPWQKAESVVASEVTWVQYIFLFPTKLTPQPAVTNTGMTGLATSSDHHHFAYLTSGEGASVWTFDTSNNQSTKVYTAVAATASAPAETLQSAVWSNDASHLLISAMNGSQAVYYVVPVGGGAATNLTATFQNDFSQLRFSPDNWQQLYFLSGQSLHRLDLGAQTVSAVLADQVVSYAFGAGRVFYIQATAVGKALMALDSNGHKQTIVESLPDSPTYQLAYSQYNGQDNLGVIPAATHSLTLYSDLFSSHPTSKLITKTADQLSFNSDGRFLTYWAGEAGGTYDLEKSVLAHQPTIYSYHTSAPIDALDWFDTYHLLSVSNGQVSVSEFDGQNRINIGSTLPGQMAFQSQSQRLIVLLQLAPNSKTQLATITVKR